MRSMSWLLVILVGCGASEGDGTSPVLEPPATADEVEATYASLGNACNDGTLTRGLTEEFAITPRNLWSPPAGDPGGHVARKRAGEDWSALIAVATVDFTSVGGEVTVTSPAQAELCGAATELVTPINRDGRRYFSNLLLYVGSHAHRTAFADGPLPPVDAPVRLEGYLSVASGVQERPGDPVIRDAREQHVPVAVACDRPLQVETRFVQPAEEELASFDPALCSAGGACLVEVIQPLAGLRCTVVAAGVAVVDSVGTERVLSVGARLEIDGERRGQLTVDRFAFH